MIKLEITIKEISYDLENITAFGTDVQIVEKASKVERKVSDILKQRLRVDEKLQFESNSKRSKEELKEELIKLLKRI